MRYLVIADTTKKSVLRDIARREKYLELILRNVRQRKIFQVLLNRISIYARARANEK